MEKCTFPESYFCSVSNDTEMVASDNRVIESILSATVELDSGYILRL